MIKEIANQVRQATTTPVEMHAQVEDVAAFVVQGAVPIAFEKAAVAALRFNQQISFPKSLIVDVAVCPGTPGLRVGAFGEETVPIRNYGKFTGTPVGHEDGMKVVLQKKLEGIQSLLNHLTKNR